VEWRISMRLRIALFVILSTLATHGLAADRAVVLVTGSACAMDEISALDVRKAYLGIGVSYKGQSLRAFRLNNDQQLNRIFYQSVVAMSEKTYKRRLLSLLLKYGRPRPREFDEPDELVAALTDIQCSIAYLWKSDAETAAGIKAIRVLWQEN